MKTRLELLEEHRDATQYALMGAEIRLTLADRLRLQLVKPGQENLLRAVEEGRAKTLFEMQNSQQALGIIEKMIEEEKKTKQPAKIEKF